MTDEFSTLLNTPRREPPSGWVDEGHYYKCPFCNSTHTNTTTEDTEYGDDCFYDIASCYCEECEGEWDVTIKFVYHNFTIDRWVAPPIDVNNIEHHIEE